MNWETGVDIYTVLILHIKSMSKDLVYSTGKSAQCSVVKQMGRKSKREMYIHIYKYIYIYIRT